MKKLQKLFVFIFITSVFVSCDYVSNPLQDIGPVDTSSSGGVVQRKVLLEDYTGHKCTACPAAAITANNISNSNSGKVIVVGVHAGFFANPSSSGTNYLADFRTPAGTTYDGTTYFNISVGGGNPNGMINRKDFNGTTSHIKSHGSWASIVAAELLKPADAKIEITNTYTSASRSLSCEVKTTFLSDTLTSGPYKLIVMMTQDSIVATQLDQGTIIPNYVHRHVLRDNLNGTWGELISNAPVTKNSPITKTYTYTLKTSYPAGTGASSDSNCNPDHCHIVAFLYNDATKEVIQVEEKSVTH